MVTPSLICISPFNTKNSATKNDYCRYARITAFFLGVILSIAAVAILSGAFVNIDEDLGWNFAAFGILGLVFSYMRCPRRNRSSVDDYLKETLPPVEIPLSSSSKIDSANSTGPAASKKYRPDNPHLRQAEIYLKNGQLSEAFTEIKKITGAHKIKESFLAKLAQANLEDANYDQAFIVIKEIYHDVETKEAFLAKLGESHLRRGQKNQAFKVIKEIYHNHKVKEALFEKLSQIYFDEENNKDAFKVIKEIYHNHKAKEDFFEKLAQAYLDKDNKEQAFTVIREIYHNHEVKEALLEKLAESYYKKKNKMQAFIVIKEIIHNREAKVSFCIKLARAYLDEGNKEEAFKITKEIYDNYESGESLFAYLAKAYFDDGDEPGIFKIIDSITRSVFIRRLQEEGHLRRFLNICQKNNNNDKIESFFKKIVRECYQECYENSISYFKNNETHHAIRAVKNKASSAAYIQECLKL